jgi:Concanavalin A-like lectin/glucanases superfamily
MTVPISPTLDDFNPRELTSEIWFKIDNVFSSLTEIILGTSPYKIRKKANVAQI